MIGDEKKKCQEKKRKGAALRYVPTGTPRATPEQNSVIILLLECTVDKLPNVISGMPCHNLRVLDHRSLLRCSQFIKYQKRSYVVVKLC